MFLIYGRSAMIKLEQSSQCYEANDKVQVHKVMMKQVMIHMLLVVDGILMILLNDTFDFILCYFP